MNSNSTASIPSSQEHIYLEWDLRVSLIPPTRSFMFTCHIKTTHGDWNRRNSGPPCPPWLASLSSQSVAQRSHYNYTYGVHWLALVPKPTLPSFKTNSVQFWNLLAPLSTSHLLPTRPTKQFLLFFLISMCIMGIFYLMLQCFSSTLLFGFDLFN